MITRAISNKFKNMSLICSLLIVFVHVGKPSVVGSGGWWLCQFTSEGISRVAVPFFFICSGFFLSRHFYEAHWYCDAIRKRVRTLLLPYFIWSLLYYGFISVLYKISPGNPVCWRIKPDVTILGHILMATGLSLEKMPMLYPLWYIRFLFVLVLIAPLFIVVARYSRIILISILGGLYLLFNPGDGSPIDMHIGFPLEGLFYFSVGCFLCDGKENDGCVARINGRGAHRLLGWMLLFLSGALIAIRALLLRNDFMNVSLLKPIYIFFGVIGVWIIVPEKTWPQIVTSSSFLIFVTHLFGLHLFNFCFGVNSDNALLLLVRIVFAILFAAAVSLLIRSHGKMFGALNGFRE